MSVTCPVCKRKIPLDVFKAKNLEGEAVMSWHLCKGFRECPGSFKSVAGAKILAFRGTK